MQKQVLLFTLSINCFFFISCFEKDDKLGGLFLVVLGATFFAYLIGMFSKVQENSNKNKSYYYADAESKDAGFGCAIKTFVIGMFILAIVVLATILNKCKS